MPTKKSKHHLKVAFVDAVISNPKRRFDPAKKQDSRLFPYYAGFSTTFTDQLLASLQIDRELPILDPWNGSGTTTRSAFQSGLSSIGTDLNPAMVIVAKAGLVSYLDLPSLVPLSQLFVDQASDDGIFANSDPLCSWLIPTAAATIRALEAEIFRSLVDHDTYTPPNTADALDRVSPLAAFFYLALFRTTRLLLRDFVASNPTWTKRPDAPTNRKRPTSTQIMETFKAQVRALTDSLAAEQSLFTEEPRNTSIRLANAEQLPFASGTIGAVISSPPYCTRIDYAVATSIELAVLGLDAVQYDSLRRSLTGTSTVGSSSPAISKEWGPTCTSFLSAMEKHHSKASKTYYLKNHSQYFDSLYKSLVEISRVTTKGAPCVLVVQDSYYKELHNDVPQITIEMASNAGLKLIRSEKYNATQSMVAVNKAAKKYLSKRTNVESVLCFRRD